MSHRIGCETSFMHGSETLGSEMTCTANDIAKVDGISAITHYQYHPIIWQYQNSISDYTNSEMIVINN